MTIDIFIILIIIFLILWVSYEFKKDEKLNSLTEDITQNIKCEAPWCDVYDIIPWKSQCSYEGTGQCGAETEF
jgi:heme/copper-type cytochrome/quinol oxidase subunit 2